MESNSIDNSVTFYELQWDTDYFGVNSAKAILNEPLTLAKWSYLKDRFKEYQFISIENRNSNPINAQMIGRDTTAFLADVNIQFNKKLEGLYDKPQNITFHQTLERREQVIKLAEFEYSKFIEDPELSKRGGNRVYNQWLLNSFGIADKYFAFSNNAIGKVDGFVLYSFSDNACIIELIAVSKDVARCGIGTSLFKAVEYAANERSCGEIRVGTQIRNLGAINFYHKVGCKQIGCHQVYHLWNL